MAQSLHLMSVLDISLRKYIRVKSKFARFEVENIVYNFLSFIRKFIESVRIILSKFGKHIK